MSLTCQVGLLVRLTPEGTRFRAYALECEQVAPWRDSALDAEVDAARMDGHECPQVRSGNHQRLVPRDALRTKSQALYAPATALRYLPERE